MSNEEMKEELPQCNGDCSDCQCEKEEVKKEAGPKSNTMPNGEKIVSFEKEPTLVDVAQMLLQDKGFLNATKDTRIVATRVLRHANGQDSVLQIFFHKNNHSSIVVTSEMPKEK